MWADYIWGCSRGAKLGAGGRVWQQWKAVTGVWEAAATKAAAMNTAGPTWPVVGATAAAAACAGGMGAAACNSTGNI